MRIQIVNDQDELIGHKERDKLNHPHDIYRVSALWLTNSRGESLLAQRASTKANNPSKWGPAVAGTIDEDESYDENIYKEAIEEIGLEGVKFTKSIKMYVTGPRRHFTQWYTAQLDRDIGSFTRQVEEVDALEWVDTQWLKGDVTLHPDKYLQSTERVIDELGL